MKLKELPPRLQVGAEELYETRGLAQTTYFRYIERPSIRKNEFGRANFMCQNFCSKYQIMLAESQQQSQF